MKVSAPARLQKCGEFAKGIHLAYRENENTCCDVAMIGQIAEHPVLWRKPLLADFKLVLANFRKHFKCFLVKQLRIYVEK